jgi:Polysaccharide lyase
MNRFQPTERCGVWQAASESAMSPRPLAWPSGGGIFETRTIHGPGFRVVATPETAAPWGGKAVWLVDADHLTPWSSFLGTTEDWAGKFSFPRSGNPEGFPVHWWSGVLVEFHTETESGPHIAIDGEIPNRPRLRYGVYDPRTDDYRFTWFKKPIVFDRWYTWRLRMKWSTGSDGFLRSWVNGKKVMDYVGPTIEVGEHPKLQFGYYSTPTLRNEVIHAAIRRTTVG